MSIEFRDDRHLKKMKDKVDEETNGKKSTNIEKDLDADIYKELYKKEKMKQYERLSSEQEEELQSKRELERNLQEYADSEEAGKEYEWYLKRDYPVLAGFRRDLNATKEFIEDSRPGRFVTEHLQDARDKNLIKNGISEEVLDEYNKLKNKYDVKNSLGDYKGAKKERIKMRIVERKMNQIIQRNKKDELKEKLEIARIQQALHPQQPVKKIIYRGGKGNVFSTGSPSLQFKTNAFGPQTDNFGVARPTSSARINDFSNYGNVRFAAPQNQMDFARQRIMQRRADEQYKQMMVRQVAIKRDEQASQAFASKKHVNTMTGVLPAFNTNALNVVLPRKSANGVSTINKINGVVLLPAKINVKNNLPIRKPKAGGGVAIKKPVNNFAVTIPRINTNNLLRKKKVNK